MNFNKKAWLSVVSDILTEIDKRMLELKKTNIFVKYKIKHKYVNEWKHLVSIGVVLNKPQGGRDLIAYDWIFEPNLYMAMDTQELKDVLQGAWIKTRDDIYKKRLETYNVKQN